MTPNRVAFETYQTISSSATVANNQSCDIVGIDEINVPTTDGWTQDQKIEGVRHVPKLEYNLMSMGYLKHQDFRVRYFDDENYFSITSPDGSSSFEVRPDRDFVYRIHPILDNTRAAAYAAISREAIPPKSLTDEELTELITTREDFKNDIDMFMVTPTGKPIKMTAKADTMRN